MNNNGLLTCLRYALPPNNLSFCGPDATVNLLAYHREQITDPGLTSHLRDFMTMYRYLAFIAYENKIADPFADEVVEAYWLGNRLLADIKPQAFYQYLTDTLQLKKLFSPKEASIIIDKLNFQPLPHHNFHVLNIFRRTGHTMSRHTLQTMDDCRINWGQVRSFEQNQIMVITYPLVLTDNKLCLGQPVLKSIKNNLRDTLLISVKPGDWVSFHWGVICDVIKSKQMSNLKIVTLRAIKLANSSG